MNTPRTPQHGNGSRSAQRRRREADAARQQPGEAADRKRPNAGRTRGAIVITVVAALIVALIYLWLSPTYGGTTLDSAALRSGWSRFLRTYKATDDQCSVLDFVSELDSEGRFLSFELSVLIAREDGSDEAYRLQFPGEGGTLPAHELGMVQVDVRLAEIQVLSLLEGVEKLAAVGFLPEKVPQGATVTVRLDGIVRRPGAYAWEESASRHGITMLDGRCFRLEEGALVPQKVNAILTTSMQPLSVQVTRQGTRSPAPGPVVLVEVALSQRDP